MIMEIDTTQINAYQKRMLIAFGDIKGFEQRFLNTLANMIMQKAIPRTPVDTGRLRRSWKVTNVRERGTRLEITVYNDAKSDGAGESYASFIEFGHFTRARVSWVEGRWMLTISTDEVRAEMQRVWDILFIKWAKGVGIY